MENARLIDLGDYPDINCFGLGDCYVIGERVRFVMWDWFHISGIWQRRIVGTLTRPLAGLEEDQRKAWAAIGTVQAPALAEARIGMH